MRDDGRNHRHVLHRLRVVSDMPEVDEWRVTLAWKEKRRRCQFDLYVSATSGPQAVHFATYMFCKPGVLAEVVGFERLVKEG